MGGGDLAHEHYQMLVIIMGTDGVYLLRGTGQRNKCGQLNSNTKKAWHPSTLKNQERVWKAEQAAAEEQRRIQELQRERAQERDREELNKLAKQNSDAIAGASDHRLSWMYDQKPDRKIQQEDYLLGKAIDKNYDNATKTEKNEIPAVSRRVVGSSMISSGGDTQVDLARKLREDPLLLVKERERAARAALLNNPVQRMKLTEMLRKEQEQKNRAKSEKLSDKKKNDLDNYLTEKLTALGCTDVLKFLESSDDSLSEDDSKEGKSKKKKKKKKKKSKKRKLDSHFESPARSKIFIESKCRSKTQDDRDTYSPRKKTSKYEINKKIVLTKTKSNRDDQYDDAENIHFHKNNKTENANISPERKHKKYCNTSPDRNENWRQRHVSDSYPDRKERARPKRNSDSSPDRNEKSRRKNVNETTLDRKERKRQKLNSDSSPDRNEKSRRKNVNETSPDRKERKRLERRNSDSSPDRNEKSRRKHVIATSPDRKERARQKLNSDSSPDRNEKSRRKNVNETSPDRKERKRQERRNSDSSPDRNEKSRRKHVIAISPDRKDKTRQKRRNSDSSLDRKEMRHRYNDTSTERKYARETNIDTTNRDGQDYRQENKRPGFSKEDKFARKEIGVDRDRYKQENKRPGLSEEERNARLAEMAAAGAEREVQRSRRVAAQLAEKEAAEKHMPRNSCPNEARVLPDSLESRIHSNRHYIQRDQRHMNEHFARR